MKASLWLALVGSLFGMGCTRPCDVSAQCGSGEACVAAVCSAVTCEAPVLLRDPQSGACEELRRDDLPAVPTLDFGFYVTHV